MDTFILCAFPEAALDGAVRESTGEAPLTRSNLRIKGGLLHLWLLLHDKTNGKPETGKSGRQVLSFFIVLWFFLGALLEESNTPSEFSHRGTCCVAEKGDGLHWTGLVFAGAGCHWHATRWLTRYFLRPLSPDPDGGG